MGLGSIYFKKRLASLSKSPERRELADREIQTLQSLLRIAEGRSLTPGELFVDLGCGDRYLMQCVEELGLVYRGFDISDCDLLSEQVPLQSSSADYVVAYSLIEHLNDPDNFLNEARRILKPGGVFILETPNWTYSAADFFNDYTHCKPYTPASLKAICTDYGFEVLGDFPNLRCKPDFYYALSCRYALAARLPFSGASSRFIPKILKGKARGIIIVAKRKT